MPTRLTDAQKDRIVSLYTGDYFHPVNSIAKLTGHSLKTIYKVLRARGVPLRLRTSFQGRPRRKRSDETATTRAPKTTTTPMGHCPRCGLDMYDPLWEKWIDEGINLVARGATTEINPETGEPYGLVCGDCLKDLAHEHAGPPVSDEEIEQILQGLIE